jgi:hypothetical protein
MRERWIGIGIVVALGLFVLFMLVVGSLGGMNPELERYTVPDIRAGAAPADRFGDAEIRIVGWYAELAGDCVGDDGGSDATVAWLQRTCPLRVLVTDQPGQDVTQAQLEAGGIRLAAPNGRPFPSRATPGGPNTRGDQLVFVGHFDDAAAAACVPDRVERCRNTFVVSDYTNLLR